MCWPHVNPVPSGAVGKDCQRRLLSRPRFVRAVAPRIYLLIVFLLWGIIGSRRGSTWPRGYTPCWQLYTDKTRVMPFIATKSVACMSSLLRGPADTNNSSDSIKGRIFLTSWTAIRFARRTLLPCAENCLWAWRFEFSLHQVEKTGYCLIGILTKWQILKLTKKCKIKIIL
jgi:hypothetical protein